MPLIVFSLIEIGFQEWMSYNPRISSWVTKNDNFSLKWVLAALLPFFQNRRLLSLPAVVYIISKVRWFVSDTWCCKEEPRDGNLHHWHSEISWMVKWRINWRWQQHCTSLNAIPFLEGISEADVLLWFFIGIFSEGKQCIALFFRRFTLQLLKVFVTSDSSRKKDFGTIGQPNFKCSWTAFHSRGLSSSSYAVWGKGCI